MLTCERRRACPHFLRIIRNETLMQEYAKIGEKVPKERGEEREGGRERARARDRDSERETDRQRYSLACVYHSLNTASHTPVPRRLSCVCVPVSPRVSCLSVVSLCRVSLSYFSAMSLCLGQVMGMMGGPGGGGMPGAPGTTWHPKTFILLHVLLPVLSYYYTSYCPSSLYITPSISWLQMAS